MIPINFLDLEYFVAAAEELSFTSAAKKLYISQQSLSAHILKLEEDFQVKLFNRSTPLTLTFAGSQLLERARSMLSLKENTFRELQALKESGPHNINVGILANRGTLLIQSLLPKLRAQHPEMKIKITEFLDDSFNTSLNNEAIDLAYGYKIESSHITFIPLISERYYLLIPYYILDRYFTPSAREEILSSLILPISHFQNCPFLASKQVTWLKQVFEFCCQNAGIVPNIVIETSSILTRLSLCLSGFGIMFLSNSLKDQCEVLLDQKQWKKLFIIEIAYQPKSQYRTLGINYLSAKRLSASSQEFIRMAQKLFPFQAE